MSGIDAVLIQTLTLRHTYKREILYPQPLSTEVALPGVGLGCIQAKSKEGPCPLS